MLGVAIFTFNCAVALLGPSAATDIIALHPAVGSLIAIPVRGERPAPIECVALYLIFGGVPLAVRPPKRACSSRSHTQRPIIRFSFNPTTNPAKLALFLQQS